MKALAIHYGIPIVLSLIAALATSEGHARYKASCAAECCCKGECCKCDQHKPLLPWRELKDGAVSFDKIECEELRVGKGDTAIYLTSNRGGATVYLGSSSHPTAVLSVDKNGADLCLYAEPGKRVPIALSASKAHGDRLQICEDDDHIRFLGYKDFAKPDACQCDPATACACKPGKSCDCKPAPKKCPGPDPEPAKLEVTCPENARIFLDDYETKSTGASRLFITPPLCCEGTYRVRCYYSCDYGPEYAPCRGIAEKQATVRPGETTRLTLGGCE